MKRKIQAETVRSRETGTLEIREIGAISNLPQSWIGKRARVIHEDTTLIAKVQLSGALELPAEWAGDTVEVSVQTVEEPEPEEIYTLDWDSARKVMTSVSKMTHYRHLNALMEKHHATRTSASVLAVPTREGALEIFELLQKFTDKANLSRSTLIKRAYYEDSPQPPSPS